MAESVLVTGATGLVGRRLVVRLLRAGVTVRALSRSPARAGLPAEVEVHGWDGRDAPARALAGTRALVHLAGEPVFGGWLSAERKRRIRDSRVLSTRSLAEALAALPASDRPEALVCASAVGYYGSRGDEVIDEGEPPGDGFLAGVCIDWEQAAARAEHAGVRSVSLRIGIVLAAEGGALAAMRLPFSLGLGARLGDGRQWMPWIHVDDVVGLAIAAIDGKVYRGPVNAVAPNPVTNRDFTAALARALGRPAFLRAPSAALRLLGEDVAGELLASRRVAPRAAHDQGFAFAHPELPGALAAEL
jgi:hypothetical protein